MKISSRRKKEEPQKKVDIPIHNPRIIVNPDGSWSFPETQKKDAPDPHWPFPTGSNPSSGNGIDPNDEEVLRRTTGGVVDINYIQTEDC